MISMANSNDNNDEHGNDDDDEHGYIHTWPWKRSNRVTQWMLGPLPLGYGENGRR